MKECTAILSGKGGVGKTFVTAALGLFLAGRGRKILLVDGDMGLGDLDIPLGMMGRVSRTIWDLARGKCFESEAILSVGERVDYLPAALGEEWRDISSSAIEAVFEDIAGRYDAVLIDCPAGLGKGLRFVKKVAEHFLLVVAPSVASLRDAEETLRRLPAESCSLLLNGFRAGDEGPASFSAMREAAADKNCIGLLPYLLRADRLAQEGRLVEAVSGGLLQEALGLVYKEMTERAGFPKSRWDSLLTRAAEENRSKAEEKKMSALSALHRRRLAADWRKR